MWAGWALRAAETEVVSSFCAMFSSHAFILKGTGNSVLIKLTCRIVYEKESKSRWRRPPPVGVSFSGLLVPNAEIRGRKCRSSEDQKVLVAEACVGHVNVIKSSKSTFESSSVSLLPSIPPWMFQVNHTRSFRVRFCLIAPSSGDKEAGQQPLPGRLATGVDTVSPYDGQMQTKVWFPHRRLHPTTWWTPEPHRPAEPAEPRMTGCPTGFTCHDGGAACFRWKRHHFVTTVHMFTNRLDRISHGTDGTHTVLVLFPPLGRCLRGTTTIRQIKAIWNPNISKYETRKARSASRVLISFCRDTLKCNSLSFPCPSVPCPPSCVSAGSKQRRLRCEWGTAASKKSERS